MAASLNRSSNAPVSPGGRSLDPSERSPSPAFAHPGATFEGHLKLAGDGAIGADFSGEIEAAGTLTIDEKGSVTGPIRAREVIVRGVVYGEITAQRLLVLTASGRVEGNVRTACIEIERNARIQGQIEMIEPLANAGSPAATPKAH